MTTLAADVARLRQVLGLQNGPTVVAGHPYGGQIIRALGRGCAERRLSGLRRTRMTW